MRFFPRRAARIGPGERVLASAALVGSPDSVAGTREALYLADQRLPWEQVRSASWDPDSGLLTVVGVAGDVHRLAVDSPTRLLQLVRERVTASVVLERTLTLPQGSARVIARRAGGGDREITWSVEYDDGADPDDPAVAALVRAALDSAHDDLGAS